MEGLEKKEDSVQQTPEGPDEVIMGAKALEAFMRRSYIAIIALKTNYDFPMKSRAGHPSLSMREFRAWCRTWDVPADFPWQITVDRLRVSRTEKELEAIEDRLLTGLDEIGEYTHRQNFSVLEWIRYGVGCPIHIPPEGTKDRFRNATVRTRELRQWMHKSKIPASPSYLHGHGRAERPMQSWPDEPVEP